MFEEANGNIYNFALLFFGVFIEPIWALAYFYMIVMMFLARNSELDSTFYTFFIGSGFAALLNFCVNMALRLTGDVQRSVFWKEAVSVSLSYLSHVFEWSYTMMILLQIASRFTIVRQLSKTSSEAIWTKWRVRMILIGTFVVPTIIFGFILWYPPKFIVQSNGREYFVGMDAVGFVITKCLLCGTVHLPFIFLGFSMLSYCLIHIRRAVNKHMDEQWVKRSERNLLYFTLSISIVHLTKVVQQVTWLIATILQDEQLLSFSAVSYGLVNTLTTFTNPILLLITSIEVRRVVHPRWIHHKITRTSTGNSQVVTSFHSRS